MIPGIDISEWQGHVDFNAVKASGIKFVLIRAGYGRSASQADNYFAEHYAQAKAAGLQVGAYWYSYAVSPADAANEARACLTVLGNHHLDYPIYFDLEEKWQFANGRNFCDSLVKSFCSVLEQNSFYAGLYISRSPLQNYISTAVAQRYAIWIAEYGSRCNYGGNYGIWQHSSTGSVPGVIGNCDLDYAYIDYATVINKKQLVVRRNPDELAVEVLNGQWGNGADRYKRLTAAGYDYAVVQEKVNQLLNRKSVDQIAREVIHGFWGNGNERILHLKQAGYDPIQIQKRVNQLL
ncbi:GH25 family lysozyme [Limosilactobacillus reuteri]|uniref:GH25 family lysozyme n=1 Tax=Limosilactobacillus reuteri TaxID=1598 RepID=UPI002E7B5547|nr:GH25 family lysozyme [Limosilactobacillus reuteri]MEE1989382.1 GH25 family lysozyme [Limosilactobacillus reuteri]